MGGILIFPDIIDSSPLQHCIQYEIAYVGTNGTLIFLL